MPRLTVKKEKLVSKRLLAVHAHPDDESSKGAATYAHYVAEGVEVLIVTCTGGERGSIQNDGLGPKPMAQRDIAGLRRLEMQAATAAVGFDHVWLGFEDSGLPENDEPLPLNCFASIPLETSAAPLVEILRRFRPQVVITYDEQGGYPHPDHIRTHEISMFAIEAAADPGRYPETGEAWKVQKVYYDRVFNTPRIKALMSGLEREFPDSPLIAELAEINSWMRERPDLATSHIDVGAHLETRDAALRAHASQVAPDSRFFFWPNDLLRQFWPWEDFQLVSSTVETKLPESDLFAGIIEE